MDSNISERREQYGVVLKMIDTSDDKIRRLVEELSEFTGSTVKAVIKEKIGQMKTEQNFLQEEKVGLEKELTDLEISPNIENQIAEISAVVRERLPVATFQGMRDLLELLHVKVIYYHSNEGVKLRVSCEIPGSGEDIMIAFS